jgi:aminomethyltransferase
MDTELAGIPVRISRTGYTGDLGYEVFVEREHALPLWDAIAEKGASYGLQPAGNLALEMVRIEAGLLLIDVDFVSSARTMFEVQKSSPFELGLDFVVKLAKPHFLGRDALAREKESGPDWNTIGLVLDIGALEKLYAGYDMPLHLPYTAWAGPVPVYADDEQRDYVGKATCGTWSPILKKYIVIARVKPPFAKSGGRVYVEETVEGRRYTVPAEVVPMPFFDPARKKA